MFEDMDPFSTIRAMVRARLPGLVAAIMSDNVGETYVLRFYTVFSRLFVDFCSLISLMCVHRVQGLRTLYRTFMVRLFHIY